MLEILDLTILQQLFYQQNLIIFVYLNKYLQNLNEKIHKFLLFLILVHFIPNDIIQYDLNIHLFSLHVLLLQLNLI